MLLAVDAGNTDTVFGLFEKQNKRHVWRTRSLPQESAANYESWLRLHFLEAGIPLDTVEKVVLGSVVPDLTGTLRAMLTSLFGLEPTVVGPDIYPGLEIAIDHPHEIGADLIANAVAAHARYPQNCVVVDFGTALTFTTISATGQILGVAILPGLKTAVKALFANTAQLPEVPLQLPESAIGKNTVHAIQAGILLGYEGLVKSMLRRIKAELGGDCIAVATGGLSSIIDTLEGEFVEIDRGLTLDGLRLIGSV
ncbi:type III pantothenate kinase [Persicitalea jodogahamensis]|uniref:Type III pantothenate kinase n=1 Tax=Persicitalea jodogahamensis TaxID=402147 RepID=A0A8J3D862_9BACT|nr:type III pantothenate kinase [Persicitalea jodogahamensis]GHB67369.1 type III pantothenate kinase [Persicitalea jodogahamensis]